MPFSDKDSHLKSDEHKNRANKILCEDCGKSKCDITKHFRSEIHAIKTQNRQQNIFDQDNIKKIYTLDLK